MPIGYSGAPAIRYLTCCEDAAREARTAVERAAANMPALPPPNYRELPHPVATAWFNAGPTIGAESSSNIVGASGAYESFANANRLFAEDISQRLEQICGRIEEVVSTDLRLPQASPQVELISQKIRLLIPTFEVILREVGSVTKQQAESMLSIAGGGGGGVEVNEDAAQTVRAETETCLRGMVLDYREYARQAREYAIKLDQQADALIPQLEATKWEFTTVGDVTSTVMTEVDDIARQNSARTKIANLRAEAQNHRNEAMRLDIIIGNLEQNIQHSGAIFETDCTECINCDTFYAGRFQLLADEMQRVAKKFQDIRDSFCPTSGITDWDTIFSIKSQMSQSQQDALFGAAVNAFLYELLADDGGPEWSVIEALLSRSADQFNNVEYAALAVVFLNLSCDREIERFFDAMSTRLEDNGTGVTSWSFCPEIVNGIQRFMWPTISGLSDIICAIRTGKTSDEFVEYLRINHPEELARLQGLHPNGSSARLREAFLQPFTDLHNAQAQNFVLFTEFRNVVNNTLDGNSNWRFTVSSLYDGPPIVITRGNREVITMEFMSAPIDKSSGVVRALPQTHNVDVSLSRTPTSASYYFEDDLEQFMQSAFGPSGIAAIVSGNFTNTDISIAVSEVIRFGSSEVIKLFVPSYFLRAGDAVMGIHGIVTASSSPELTAAANITGNAEILNAASFFGLNAVVVTPNGVGQQNIHVFPAPHMQATLDIINEVSLEKGICLERFDGKIEIHHVLADPIGMNQFYHTYLYSISSIVQSLVNP